MSLSCTSCRHTYQAHELGKGDSLLRVGRCMVPGCECRQYADKIEKIDEDLL